MTEIAKLGFHLSRETIDAVYANAEIISKNVKFVPYKIGSICNATKSVTFSSAQCDLSPILTCHNNMLGLDFNKLYRKGFEFIEKLFSGSLKAEGLEEPYKTAFCKLFNYLQDMETHQTQQKSLLKVLKPPKDTKLTESQAVVAVAEHLLGKLCPGNSYVIDQRSKEEGCKCKCDAKINYGGTGIGNENVWHGYLDVVFQSHEGLICGTVAFPTDTDEPEVKKAKIDLNGQTDVEMGSGQDGKNCVDVKVSFSDPAATDQIAAQTIVFSLLQKNRHPQLDNFLIPTIAISATRVRIYMYDADNDILLRCQEMPIFEASSNKLSLKTLLILWMVLHYRIFCSGIHPEDMVQELELLKSGFAELIIPFAEFYEELRSMVPKFPDPVDEVGYTNEHFYNAISVFKPGMNNFNFRPIQF